jgi:glycosyltransferase involved in cell wall biosynthesis
VEVNDAVFWIYPKNYHAPAIIDHFKPAKVVVDIVDDHRAWPGVSEVEKNRLTGNYRETLARADMAFVNCEPMRETMKELFPDILLVPNGCDTDPLIVEPRNSPEYETFKAWPSKTIGFVGNLEAKIDIDLMKKVARRFENCQIVLIGSTHMNSRVVHLREHLNVRLPGVVPYEHIGAWLRKFDVGIVPHFNMPLTQNMNPLKIYVYLAARIPVVSTETPNIDRSTSLINVAKNHDQFLDMLEKVLTDGNVFNSELDSFIKTNSWASRFCSKIDLLMNTHKVNT